MRNEREMYDRNRIHALNRLHVLFHLRLCHVREGGFVKRSLLTLSALLMGSLVACRVVSAGEGARTSTLIERISYRESRNNDDAIGDHGDSLGRFQMSSAAWADVNSLRRSQRLPEFQHGFAHDPGIGREYCVQFLHILNSHFHRTFGRDATETELLRMYRKGFSGSKYGRHKVRSASLKKGKAK